MDIPEKRKAVFMDKDGTLIPDIPYNVNTSLITISRETMEVVRAIRRQGYLFIIISNQPGIARGYFDDDAMSAVWQRIGELLAEEDLAVDAFYYCPHDSSPAIDTENILCECRKPRPGMLLEAASDFNIDLKHSWMVGDILNDVEAGNRAGCRTVLLDNGNETEWKMSPMRIPTHTITSISDLVPLIDQQVTHETKKPDIQGNRRAVHY